MSTVKALFMWVYMKLNHLLNVEAKMSVNLSACYPTTEKTIYEWNSIIENE